MEVKALHIVASNLNWKVKTIFCHNLMCIRSLFVFLSVCFEWWNAIYFLFAKKDFISGQKEFGRSAENARGDFEN